MKEKITRCGFDFEIVVFPKPSTMITTMVGESIRGKPIKCVIQNPVLKQDDRTICFYREFSIRKCIQKYFCCKISDATNVLNKFEKDNEDCLKAMDRKILNTTEHLERINVNPEPERAVFPIIREQNPNQHYK